MHRERTFPPGTYPFTNGFQVQNLLMSMKETEQLKQQVLLEKLRLIRLKTSSQDEMKSSDLGQDLDDEEENNENKENGVDEPDVSDQDAKDAEERETPDLDEE